MKASRTISDPVFERYYVEASMVMAYPISLLVVAEESVGYGNRLTMILIAEARQQLLAHTIEVLGRVEARIHDAKPADEPRPRRLN